MSVYLDFITTANTNPFKLISSVKLVSSSDCFGAPNTLQILYLLRPLPPIIVKTSRGSEILHCASLYKRRITPRFSAATCRLELVKQGVSFRVYWIFCCIKWSTAPSPASGVKKEVPPKGKESDWVWYWSVGRWRYAETCGEFSRTS